jgi:hypothetical protein
MVVMVQVYQTGDGRRRFHRLWIVRNVSHRSAYNGRMATTSRALTVRLERQDYERLEREATRLGMRPGTLARVLIRASLGAPERRPEHPSVSLEQLFDRLARLREGLPPVDAVSITAAGRTVLEARGEP